jgi:uncharacterized membrane protein YwzB
MILQLYFSYLFGKVFLTLNKKFDLFLKNGKAINKAILLILKTLLIGQSN